MSFSSRKNFAVRGELGPSVLEVGAALLLLSNASACSTGYESIPIAPEMPAHLRTWQEVFDERREEYLEYRDSSEFPRDPVDPSTPSTVIAANETGPVDTVMIRYECGRSLDHDRFWIGIIEGAVRGGAHVLVHLAPMDGMSDDEALRLCGERIAARGIDVERDVAFVIDRQRPTSIWIRDTGPFFARDRVDHPLSLVDARAATENENFVDEMAASTARRIGASLATLPLTIDGGNFLPNGNGLCVTSSLVFGHNPQYSEAEVRDLVRVYLGCDELVVVDAIEDDATGHVDMWLAWADEHTLVVGRYTEEQDAINSAIIERNVDEQLHGLRDPGTGVPVEIVRMPMPSNCPYAVEANGVPERCDDSTDRVWRSYMNVVFVNGVVILPVYEEAPQHEAEAVRIWESLGLAVHPVLADLLIDENGALHCLTKTIDSAPAR